MKLFVSNSFVVTLLFFLAVIGKTVAQGYDLKPAYIGIGITKSHINGSGIEIHDELGFYVQAATAAKINSFSSVVGEIQFSKHTNKFDGIERKVKYAVQSLNLAVFYKVYIGKSINFGAGAQSGFLMRPRLDHRKVDIVSNGHLGLLANIGYDFERISINLRGVRYITDSRIFDNTMQLGVAYLFP